MRVKKTILFFLILFPLQFYYSYIINFSIKFLEDSKLSKWIDYYQTFYTDLIKNVKAFEKNLEEVKI